MSKQNKQQVVQQPVAKPVLAAKPVNTIAVAPVVKAPECHSGNVFVFSYDFAGCKVEFYGGGTNRSSMHTADMILIALQSTDYGDVPPVSFKGLSMPSLDKYKTVRIINIAVQDGSAPMFPLQFWQDLLAELIKLATGELDHKLKVLVRCMGGHGRTGVVLCALAVAANVCPGQDSIAWVRKHYCKKAVESNEQFDYIEMLSGIPSKEDLKMPPFPAASLSTGAVPITCTQPTLVGMETTGKTPTTTLGSVVSTLDSETKESNEINPLAEEGLVTAIFLNDDAVWQLEFDDGQIFKSPEDPTVFGVPLLNGMYGDDYVNEIWYMGDYVILALQGGTRSYITTHVSDSGELELLEIAGEENETSIESKEY